MTNFELYQFLSLYIESEIHSPSFLWLGKVDRANPAISSPSAPGSPQGSKSKGVQE